MSYHFASLIAGVINYKYQNTYTCLEANLHYNKAIMNNHPIISISNTPKCFYFVSIGLVLYTNWSMQRETLDYVNWQDHHHLQTTFKAYHLLKLHKHLHTQDLKRMKKRRGGLGLQPPQNNPKMTSFTPPTISKHEFSPPMANTWPFWPY